MAWVVGIACAAVVGALVWLAAPLLPASLQFVDQQVNPPTSGPAAGDGGEVATGEPVECRDLYVDALWASLAWTEDAVLTPSADRPATSATGLVDALSPAVRFTCAWTSASGAISTTLADVPADAGAIARTALPALGFACSDVGDRVRCVLDADGRVETIEAGGGRWLSSVQDGWHPAQYASRVADRVWVP